MHIERICEKCLSYMLLAEITGWLKCPACSFMKKENKSMISAEEILMGRAKQEDLSDDLKANLEKLLEAVNKFRKEYGSPMYVSSGYRPAELNKNIGGGSKSAHMTIEACDFRDNDGKLFEFIKKDPSILERCGLYLEDPQYCPSWIHLQVRKAGKRIFLPYGDGRAIPAPERKID